MKPGNMLMEIISDNWYFANQICLSILFPSEYKIMVSLILFEWYQIFRQCVFWHVSCISKFAAWLKPIATWLKLIAAWLNYCCLIKLFWHRTVCKSMAGLLIFTWEGASYTLYLWLVIECIYIVFCSSNTDLDCGLRALWVRGQLLGIWTLCDHIVVILIWIKAFCLITVLFWY